MCLSVPSLVLTQDAKQVHLETEVSLEAGAWLSETLGSLGCPTLGKLLDWRTISLPAAHTGIQQSWQALQEEWQGDACAVL